MAKQLFNIKGMTRDLDPTKSPSQYAYDIRNLRITAQEDSTLLALTTEKGNTKYTLDLHIKGIIVGYCTIGKYLILFTCRSRNLDLNYSTDNDHIYRLEETSNTQMTCIELFQGDLGFDASIKIETLGIYENENIQKVYWIDGKHQPRFINIVKEDPNYIASSFDFVPELKLEEEVTIEKITNGNGIFSPGVIQYAFTYYNKYGVESNIFYITELNYISYEERGASPEDSIPNAFKITISNLDTNFEYLRIYSIHRSSINDIPQVKQVIDLNLSDLNPATPTIEYIDKNTNTTSVDPTLLLYIGGRDVVAQTMTAKNNTLFLGNIKLQENLIEDSLKDSLKSCVINESLREVSLLNMPNISNYYHYSNQMQYENTSTFKYGEHYRLGLQFQYKNGVWSEPCFLQDYTISEVKPSLEGRTLKLPILTTQLSEDIQTQLIDLGYKKVRPIAVFPEEYERLVIAQGIVNPTVFNVGNRLDNSPFSQASWFFRPFISKNFSDINNNDEIMKGSIVEFRHQYCLHTPLKVENQNNNYARSSEIQNMYECPSLETVTSEIANKSYLNKTYFVDNAIITFHSPDIEFNESLDIKNSKFRIVGITPINSNVGDIDIQTSTPQLNSLLAGFIHKSLQNMDGSGRQLTSGLFYADNVLNLMDGNVSGLIKDMAGYLVFPWQREGSLNNDITRSSQTALLKTKVISNLKFSNDNIWLSEVWKPRKDSDGHTGEILDVQKILDINQVSITKLNITDTSIVDDINYYGSIDTVLTSGNYPKSYVHLESTDNDSNTTLLDEYKDFNSEIFTNTPIKAIGTAIAISSLEDKFKHTTDPIRMRYKTMPHAVIELGTYRDEENNKIYQEILPTINNLNLIWNDLIPFWEKNTAINRITSGYTFIDIETSNKPTIPLAEGDVCKDSIVKNDNTYTLYECTESGKEAASYTYNNPPETTKYKVDNGSTIELFEYILEPTYKTDDDGNYIIDENSTYKLIRTNVINKQVSYGGIQQDSIPLANILDFNKSGLFLCELYRDEEDIYNAFGGNSSYALKQNKWLPVGNAISLNNSEELTIESKYGDTWYQRYDCLKTIPWSNEDTNQIVDICSFMCETRINIDGRYDRNRGLQSNLNINNTNFNLLNKVYTQQDNFFTYRYLDSQDYTIDKFPNQIMWSKTKIYGDEIDAWTQIIPTSILDMDGSLGEVRALKLWNNNLICFQDKGISQIMYNERTTLSTQQGVPIEIANSGKVDGSQYISNQIGCSNKDTIQITQNGIYFVDDNTKEIYRWSKGLESISKNKGFNTYLNTTKINKSFYDPKLRDIYFQSEEECLVFNEQLEEFTSFLDYTTDFMLTLQDTLIAIKNNNLWKQFEGDYLSLFGNNLGYSIDILAAENPTIDKIFSNIELRATVLEDSIQEAGSNKVENNSNIKPFTEIRAWNEYQDTGTKDFNLKQKFRIWRGDIPRDKDKKLDRIRNPWTRIKLSDKGNNKHTIIHDLGVIYY